MNSKDRDELARISERTFNIWRVVENIERQQTVQNGHIISNMKSTTYNTTWRKVHTWVIGAIWLVVIALINRIW